MAMMMSMVCDAREPRANDRRRGVDYLQPMLMLRFGMRAERQSGHSCPTRTGCDTRGSAGTVTPGGGAGTGGN